jgi:LuxR family transcriptional regulator, maltose regulon positive regulatory protein
MPGTTGRVIAHRKGQPTGGGDAVLASKITVPPAPEWIVSRERVDRFVAAGARGPLTVVTGPPGAGKTVALASWAASRPPGGPIAWVTLDRFDNRPDVFWCYVVEALRRAGVPLPADLPSSPARQPDLFLHQVSSAIASYHETVTLVLDDVHMLTDPRSLDGISYVLRNASEGLRLLVASRMDPLLPLHRYRLTGELAEIRAVDLAFTEAEAGLLMAQHGVSLPPEWLKVLTRRHEGWAAGLRLAAISLDGHPNPEVFIKELEAEDGAIAGYLVDEVLNSQPAPVRDLLLKTSILDRVTVGLAAEVTGNEQAAEAIPQLAHANAFVEPMGQGWYRYHSLFADVLRLKLRHQSPGEVAELRRRAARWLRSNGTLREAVGQATAAGDWALAARIVVDEFAVGPLLSGGAAESALSDAFKQLPTGPTSGEPRPGEAPLLAVKAAMALRSGQHQACDAWLGGTQRLLDCLPAGHEVPARLASALIRVALARRTGDFAAAAAAAARAACLLDGLEPDLLARHPEVPAQVLAARGAVEMWAGRFDAAASLLEAAASITRDPCMWGACVGLRALLEALRGRLNHAAVLAATASSPPWHRRPRTAWQPRAGAEIAHAWVQLERNQLGESGAALSRADDALRGQPDRLIGALAWLVAARHNIARDRTATVAEMLSRARRGWSPPGWLEQRLAVVQSQACAADGDIRGALAAAGAAGPPASLMTAVALAHVHLAGQDWGAAARALARASGSRETPQYVQLEAMLIEAEIGYGAGQADRARQSLSDALKLAGGERLLLPFALQRAWIEPALRHDTGLAETFRRLFEPGDASAAAPAQPSTAGPAAPVVVEQLSGRELEVLQLASKMLTTAEIADEMYLSVNTVKSHLKSIFRKLGTSHRGEAVRTAQRLALLLPAPPYRMPRSCARRMASCLLETPSLR